MNDISRSYLAARAALPPTRLVPAWLALALDVEFGEQASAIAALWTARHPAVVREDGSTGIDDRHEEYGDLLELLLEGAATSSTHTVAIARWIALSCFGEDHLWEDLGLPELAEVADIMRLANDESSEVYRQLRARSASVRSSLLSSELAQAGVVEERMYLPASLLGVVFLALLMAPPLLRLFGAS